MFARGKIRRGLLVVLVNVALLGMCAGVAELELRRRHHSWLEAVDERIQKTTKGTMGMCVAPPNHEGLYYSFHANRCGNNSAGYPDREHTREKVTGTSRIVIIGDSVAAGWGVEREETFGRVLERRLAASGLRVEVILLARAGYSTSEQLVIFEEEAFDYDPDLIVWSYCLNDPAHPLYHNVNNERARYFARPRSFLVALLEWIWFEAREVWAARNCPREWHARLHCVYAEEISERVAAIGSISATHRVPVVFMIHPVFEEGSGGRAKSFEDYSVADVHRRLSDIAAANGLYPLDLLSVYSDYDPNELKVHTKRFDPWHLGVRGHLLAAESLQDLVARAGLLEASSRIPPKPTSRRNSSHLSSPWRSATW